MRDLVVRGGRVVSTRGVERHDVWIRAGIVAEVGPTVAAPPATPELDAQRCLVFAGLVDPQVHFREPGFPEKEDLASGSLAAIGGGVTCFFEMPNTKPATTTPELLADKLARAAGRAHADYAFFLGATAENADRLAEWEALPGCCGVKVFMGSSTGNLLVPDDDTLARVLRSGTTRVAVHSEDEPRLRQRYAAVQPGTHVREHPMVRDVECALRATTRLLDLAERCQRRVHVLHISTAEEIALIRARKLGDLVTCEVTPNHLFMTAPECYERYGSLMQMNPPVRDERHRDVLRAALADGTIQCIGSDHAPHTLAEKGKPYPASPSGIPGVQTTLGLLLTAVRDGWLSLSDVARVCCAGPAAVYSLRGKGSLAPGCDGDLVVVDPAARPLPLSWLHSRVGYSPYVGIELAGWPRATVLRGKVVYRLAAAVGDASGEPVRFTDR